ncbi:hypothetical protein BDN70DRAFT_919182 [Pholiota conissans]|uniref:F-box domain-containing protein n=1 Tax=Pholiota conissans TaxID=109636 RepID=A0A9P5Z8Z0_9AGAR|nr:hypothetical protein BDN70DRAFT_919182 [Pholiota conissans]
MKRSLRKIKQNAARKIGTVIPLSFQDNELLKLSPVPDLFFSNLPPSEEETSFIRNAIAETETILATIEEELTSGTSSSQSAKALSKRRSKYQEFLRLHRCLISPLRRLPDDILSEIFKQAAYSKRGVFPTPPWAISQTCSDWRALALDLPLLWNYIHIDLDEQHKTHAFLQYLDMLFHRSRSSPLDLYISCARSKLNYNQHPTIGILTKHSERLRFLFMNMSGQTLRAFKDIKGHLCGLNSLMLRLHGPFPDESIDIFEVAPQLQSLDVEGLPPPKRLIVPWSQILTYSDDCINSNARDTVLASSPSLEDIHFNCRSLFFPRLWTVLPSTRLEKLSRFSMEFRPSLSDVERPPERFFDGLTLPALEELRLINFYDVQVERTIKHLILRSHTSLRKLELSCPSESLLPGTLTAILGYMPHLTHLITTLPHHTDLSNLVLNPENPNIVPSLQTLVLHIPQGTTDGEELVKLLAALVTSRYDNGDYNYSRTPMTFRLVFYDLYQCLSTREQLEIMHRGPTSKEGFQAPQGKFYDLAVLRSRFRKQLSRVSVCIAVAGLKAKLKSNYPGAEGISRQVLELFNEIDAFQIDKADELHTSHIHHILYHVSRLIDETALAKQDEWTNSWKEKADTILEKWNPMLTEGLANRCWTFQGFQSIVYTPDGNLSLKKIYGTQFFGNKYDEEAWMSAYPGDLHCKD